MTNWKAGPPVIKILIAERRDLARLSLKMNIASYSSGPVQVGPCRAGIF